MSATAWFVTLAVLVVVLLLAAGTATLIARRRRPVVEAPLVAEPEDRPLAVVVVNPVKIDDAGRVKVTETCLELGWAEPLWIETTVDDPGSGQARDALDKGADVVLACGGDGTVRAVAHVLAGTDSVMGLLPAGTGNLLARTLGTPTDLAAATRIALTGDDRAIDVGRVRVDDGENEDTFLVMAGTGFDAAIMENTPEGLKGKVGPLAYVVSGLRAMRGRRTGVVLHFDGGGPVRRRSRTVVVGNSGTLLGGLVLMPEATIDDGQPRRGQHRAEGLRGLGRGAGAGGVAQAARALARRALAGTDDHDRRGRPAARADRRRSHRGRRAARGAGGSGGVARPGGGGTRR